MWPFLRAQEHARKTDFTSDFTWMTSHMPARAMSLDSASCCWRVVACGGRGAELLCDRRPGVDRELPPCHWVRPAR